MTSTEKKKLEIDTTDEVIAPTPVKRYFRSTFHPSTPSSKVDTNFDNVTEEEIQQDFNSIKSKSEITFVKDEIISVLVGDNDLVFKPCTKAKSSFY